jgi:hypothetical protein
MLTINEAANMIAGTWISSSEPNAFITLENYEKGLMQARNPDGESWSLANGQLEANNGQYRIKMGYNNGHTLDGVFASDLASIRWSNGTAWARTASVFKEDLADELCGAWTYDRCSVLIATKDRTFTSIEGTDPVPPDTCYFFDPNRIHWKSMEFVVSSRNWCSGEFDGGNRIHGSLSEDLKVLKWNNGTSWERWR